MGGKGGGSVTGSATVVQFAMVAVAEEASLTEAAETTDSTSDASLRKSIYN